MVHARYGDEDRNSGKTRTLAVSNTAAEGLNRWRPLSVGHLEAGMLLPGLEGSNYLGGEGLVEHYCGRRPEVPPMTPI